MTPIAAASSTELRTSIKAVLRQMADSPSFGRVARDLLEVLGYPTDRTLAKQTGKVDDFLAVHKPVPGFQAGTKSEQALRKENPAIKLLCQVTNEDLDLLGQHSLLEQPDIDQGLHHSFLFVTVDLEGERTYRRGDYAQYTREINKRFLMPTVVLYRYPLPLEQARHYGGGLTSRRGLTVAFIQRRRSRRDEHRDVLETVSLIRDIDVGDPHQAHLRLLEQLSIGDRRDWMRKHGQPSNFDGLLQAWVDTLDTDTLNKEFYRRLFDWFQRAVAEATFPAGDSETKQEEQVIRLITRLLFIWFMKEKDLVSDDLFIPARAEALLRDYDPREGDTYYPAILHNLFFATLNTEYDDQVASRREPHHYLHTELIDDLDCLIGLFDKTPFINGGLFDRLDPDDRSTTNEGLIDRQLLSVPNRLFFDEAGIITLLDSYKFTLEENTPIDQDVALDPELLGKVFENLLAAHNPETRTTARKRTGSYYTPRLIVDYMVDEALARSLTEACRRNGSNHVSEELLRQLLDHGHEFQQDPASLPADVKRAIVEAVATIKILDPAVGSGAFPMSILHKLTLVLQRLDPDNQLWEHFQRQLAVRRADEALHTDDQEERDQQLLAISETFQKYRETDFGRKLYLIQNSIYGVDIQPIACQIAKLRFFIALAIDQTPDPTATNHGIRPLPNLETKFSAADTLIGLRRQQALTPPPVEDLLRQLDANREQHFLAIPQHKRALREEHRALRTALADELAAGGMPSEHTERITDWDPYDQNTKADWFDPKYMFGVLDGFDVVIGNPPYVESRSSLLSSERKDAYQAQVPADWGDTLPRGSDLLMYFFPRGLTFLSGTGWGCFITQNGWLNTDYGKKFQDFAFGRFGFHEIIDSSAKFFPDADAQNINTVILTFSRRRTERIRYSMADEEMVIHTIKEIPSRHTMKWGHLIAMPEFYNAILERVRDAESEGGSRYGHEIGQGLNFPKRDLNAPGADVPVITDGISFVAEMTSDFVGRGVVSRRRRLPALVMPRGIGDRFCCTFNECEAFSYSGVEVYLPDDLWHSDYHYGLWAYLNSSFAWLYREITGRKNLGGGMLKAEATDLSQLPMNIEFGRMDDVRDVFSRIRSREPLPVREEVYTDEHLLIDDVVATELGFASSQGRIRQVLVEQVDFRLQRSRS